MQRRFRAAHRAPVVWAAVLFMSGAALVNAGEFDGLFAVRPDGSGIRQLLVSHSPRDLMSPRWSHDGARLVFSAQLGQNGRRMAFLVEADGSGVGELGLGRVADFSPDDKQLMLKTSSAPPILVQNLDGSGRTQIATGDSPRWSPDGSRVAVSDGTMLRVIDLVTLEETTLFRQPHHKIFEGFSWSHDGRRLAVVTRAEEKSRRELLLVDATGKGEPISRAKGEMGGFVSFSPDDKQIVFSDFLRLHIVDVEGNKSPRIIPGQKGKNRHPAWSPDGKWIAYVGSIDDAK